MSTTPNGAARTMIEQILQRGAPGSGHLLASRPIRWAAAGVGVVALALVAWSMSGTRTTVRYVSAPAERGNLIVVVTATGSVQPTKKVDVSSELSGTVRKVLVDFNSPVKAGQPLAELDTDKLRATVESSRARLAAARARVTDAKATIVEKERDLDRKRQLAAKQITSAHDLDVAQAASDRAVAGLAIADADVGVAEADLRLNETNLAKACICSPIDGVVLKRNIDPGQTVAASLQAPVLFSIAEDLRQMELQVDVDEADVGKVAVGQKASFTVDAFPDQRFPAAIRDVRYASETVQGVVTYKAVLDIDNAALLLRPGMTATAEIRVTEITQALLISNAALRYTPPVKADRNQRGFLQRLLPGRPQFREASQREETAAERTIWVLRNGTPQAVKVAVGASDGRRTEVRSGAVQPGEAIVIDRITPKA